jgi:type IV secretion system protein VirD4
MARTLARSDFRFEDLRSRLCTVFVVLPPERLAAHARWLRLLVVQAVFALSSAGPTPEGESRPPVLFLLDEFAALGRLEPVLNAFGLMAGYGVQLWAILQDIHQLRGTYGRNAGTFLSNAGLIQIFNVADTETAGWVSRALGGATEVFQTTGASASRSPGRWASTQSASRQENVTRRDLLTPDEVMRLASDRMILLRPGLAPTLARKVRYFEDPEFKDLYPRL